MQKSSTNGPNDNTAALHPRFTQLVPMLPHKFFWEVVSDSEYIPRILFPPDLTSGLDAPIPEDIDAKASVATVVKNEIKG